jgi:hypothetical protein
MTTATPTTFPLFGGWRNRLRIPHKGSAPSVSDAEVAVHHNEKRSKTGSVPNTNPTNTTETNTSISVNVKIHAGPRKNVHFSDVEVRIYNRILGDNPYVEIPLSIGWKYTSEETLPVDEHEARQFQADYLNAKNMEPMEEVAQRMEKLLSAGIPKEVIQRDERRRKIQIVKEWLYRNDPKDTTPCTCHYGQILIQRYLIV